MRVPNNAVAALALLMGMSTSVPCPGQTAELLSTNSAGTDSGNGTSGSGGVLGADNPSRRISSDGRFVAFSSLATDLTATSDTNAQPDVFVRDRLTGSTILVSVNLAGTAAGNGRSLHPAISADGTKVVFISEASDLVAGDTNGAIRDVFVRDLVAGTTTLVSVNSAGTGSGNNTSSPEGLFGPSLSADGTKVAFSSNASDLATPQVFSVTQDVYVRDLVLGATTVVSINPAGTSDGNGFSDFAQISADGTAVLFRSNASNLTAEAITGGPNLFVRDLVAGTTFLVNIDLAGTGNGNGVMNDLGTISADGSRVAFANSSTDLTAIADGNVAGQDAFVRDVTAGTTTLVSVNLAGTASGNTAVPFGSTPAVISADGSRVAFHSHATDLVSVTDANGTGSDLFSRDLTAGTTTLVSLNSSGTASGFSGTAPLASGVSVSVSGDGSVIAFLSGAPDLAPLTSSTAPMGYVRDLTSGITIRFGVNAAGTAAGNLGVFAPAITPSGGVVSFFSDSTDLVAPDTNAARDAFIQLLAAAAVPDISIDDVTLAEGNAGTTIATFTVSLSAASASTVTVDFLTNGVTATSGTDFVGGSGTVTFEPTDVSEPVTVTINGDLLDELNETFTVDLSNPSNATILDGQGVGTITDDDPPPSISISDATVAEGDAGTTNASFTVSLSAVSGLPVSVDFTTLDGSATQPGDYTLTTGTLVIPANTPSAPILVPVVGDTAVEGNETFTVSLSLPVNATIADGTATGTITDNDGQDFTLTSVECCIECVAGFKASYHLTIAPVSTPVTSPVALSCSGLPSLSTCTFTPSSVTPGSSPANAIMLIETTGTAGSPGASLRTTSPIYAIWLGTGLGLVGVLFTGSAGRRRKARAGLAALLALLMLSCASSAPSTPSGTYTITVTATGSNFTHTFDVKLIVTD